MKFFIFVVALLTAAAAGVYAKGVPPEVTNSQDQEATAYNYHAKVGIAQAQRLRLAEEQMPPDASRIAGGSQAAAGEHPYLVGISIWLTNNQRSICGGSMLSNTRALTAAHCWWDGGRQAREFVLAFGTDRLYSGHNRVNTTNVQMHGSWNPNNNNNNIAMIIFTHVDYSNVIQPVALATGTATYAGTWAQASGYGLTDDRIDTCWTYSPWKSHVTLQVITNAVCQQTYGTSFVTAANICTSGAGGVGACSGDSGGPLTTVSNNRFILIGIISYGSTLSCQRNLPTVHTRVTSYTAWINDRL